jgi:hypothetical protein
MDNLGVILIDFIMHCILVIIKAHIKGNLSVDVCVNKPTPGIFSPLR